MSRHIVGLSGGKDSVAMALLLREKNPAVDYEYVCTPTGNELPEMVAHWERLAIMFGKPLTMLRVFEGDGLIALIRQEKMIPNFRARFCTRILKIEPMLKLLAEAAPCFHYVGLRVDEEERQGIYGDVPGVEHKFPLREAGYAIEDVWDLLDRHGVSIPERSDCGLCFFQRIREWKKLHRNHQPAYQAGIDIETEIGATFRSPKRDSWPASMVELAAEFNAGRPVKGESIYRQRQLFDCDREALCRVCSL